MIGRRYLAGAAALALLATTAAAATVDDKGAQSLKKTLLLGQEETSPFAQSLSVKPDGNRYEVVFDLAKLVAEIKIPDFVIRGLQPIVSFMTPRDDGMWAVESNGRLDTSGTITQADKPPSDFRFVIGSSTLNTLVDPSLSFVRSGTVDLRDLAFDMKGPDGDVAAKTGSVLYNIQTNDSADGKSQTIKASGSTSGLVETANIKDQPPFDFRVNSINFDLVAEHVPLKLLNDTFKSVAHSAHDPEAFSAALKAKLPAAFPLLTAFRENVSLSDLSISTGGTSLGSAASFGYSIFVDGPSDATRFGLGFNARTIAASNVLVPDAYQSFLPQTFDMEVALPNLDFGSFWNTASNGDSSEAAMDAAVASLFADNRMVIDMPRMKAVSTVYDVEVSGRLSGDFSTKEPKNVDMEATVLARDLDKTIAAVQQIAKVEPNANTASMGLMMAKGFAKIDADGRSRWEIAVSRDGAVTINGQQIKGPDAVPQPDEAPEEDAEPQQDEQ